MITFIHTADLHFGVENYGSIDPKTGFHTRLLDFNTSFNTCIDYAIEQDVDFFLFTGDAYKTAQPTPAQQKLLLCSFLRLHKAGIPTIIITGNHDIPLSFGKVHALDLFGQLPIEGFTVIERPQTHIIKTKQGSLALIALPWPNRSALGINSSKQRQSIDTDIRTILTEYIHTTIAKIPEHIPIVIGGHLTVSEGLFSGSEKKGITSTDPLLFPSDLIHPRVSYVGLGHLHRFQDLNKNGSHPLVYAGSIDRIDFGERTESKGFCHVTIDTPSNKTSYTFVELNTRPFIQIDVVLSPHIFEHTSSVLDELKKHDLQGSVIKITYTVPAGIKDHVDKREIEKACAHAHYFAGIYPLYTYQVKRRAHIGTLEDRSSENLLRTYLKNTHQNVDIERLMSKFDYLKQEQEILTGRDSEQ